MKNHRGFYEPDKKIKRNLSKLSIVVIRWADEQFKMSKPCVHCIRYLKLMNINKIYYSDGENNLICCKVHKLESNHISQYNRRINY